MANARAFMVKTKRWPARCGQCKKPVLLTDEWVVGHIKSRAAYPELMWVTSNWRIEHRRCSNKTGTAAIIEKATKRALRSQGRVTIPQRTSPPLPVSPSPAQPGVSTMGQDPHFSPQAGAGETPPLPVSLPPEPTEDLVTTRTDLTWNPDYLSQFEWLVPLLDVPDDAAVPLMMSPVPVDAVGTYGWMAIEWIEREQHITLRWWQRLSLVRQLEHRANGSLCWRTKVESAPRRAGKSVGLRGHALWRMEHGQQLFDEVQTVVHTGSDLAICREIQMKAWRWSESHGWVVTRGNGKECIETQDGSRWMTRAQPAVYGYDVTVAMVDEGWNVKPDTVSEGLEPGMLERSNPQLIMTSTAHRRATSLMRTYLVDAMTGNDPTVLLLLWAAPLGSDPGDPRVWKAASPFWSEDRRRMIAAKYEKALAGEEDPEFDDPDPMRGFESQYLNIWKVAEPRTVGNPVISEEEWETLLASVLETTVPDSTTCEAWYGQGVAVARAWKPATGPITTSVQDFPDLASAAGYIKTLGYKKPVLVGTSLAEHSSWKEAKIRVTPISESTRSCIGDLMRALAGSAFRHDGSALLSHQVLHLRISPGSDGPRIRSTERADAIKAAMWSVQEASLVKRGMVLPSRFKKRNEA